LNLQFTTRCHNTDAGVFLQKPKALEAAIDVLLEKSRQKANGYLTVNLSLPHRPRTTGWKSQNHHLRGHARQLCGYTGYTMNEMMQIIKEDTPSWPVEYQIFHGKKRQIYASEADISMEVAGEAIEICHVIAADNKWILKEE